jgi:hypothetical protein
LARVLQGFADLITLPSNWDGEGAAEIDLSAINRALAAIERILPPNAPAPSVVPVPDSGLQIEWHRNQKDLEIEFRPNGEVEFYFFDEPTGRESRGLVDRGFTNLQDYLSQIW